MPTNDLGHDTRNYRKPEFKHDASTFRSRWLDRMESAYQYPMAWFMPTGCWLCTATRYVFTLLALYGLYSLLF